MANGRNINWVSVMLGIMGFMLSMIVFVLSLVFASISSINDTLSSQQEFREKQIAAMSTITNAMIDLEKRVEDSYGKTTLDSKFENVGTRLMQAQMQIDELKSIDRRNEDWMVRMDNRQDDLEQLLAILKARTFGNNNN